VIFSRRKRLRLELQFIQFPANAALLDQFSVFAGFDDFTFVEHDNEIGFLDGGKAERDAGGGAPLHEFFQPRLFQ
jgi:hypothetical protein